MAISPILRDEHLTLQPFTEDLISPRYLGWLNNQELMQYSRQRFLTHTVTSCQAFARSFETGPDYFWAIIAQNPALGHIGNLTATIDPYNKTADLAIMVGEAQAKGLGFGCAAWQLAMTYLLTAGGYRKVTAGTMSVNLAMIRIMQKTGMIEDGCRKRHFLYAGQEVDCLMYAKFRDPHTH